VPDASSEGRNPAFPIEALLSAIFDSLRAMLIEKLFDKAILTASSRVINSWLKDWLFSDATKRNSRKNLK
jgi:hypothetical protein